MWWICVVSVVERSLLEQSTLPSVVLGKKDSMNCTLIMTSLSNTLCRALDKVFTECQLKLDKKIYHDDAKWWWRSLCRVCRLALGKEEDFSECLLSWHSAKVAIVSPMPTSVLSVASWHFAKAVSLTSVSVPDTRQRELQWAPRESLCWLLCLTLSKGSLFFAEC